MIDRQQSRLENQAVNVRIHTEGVAPYIPIGLDQLDDVTQFLDGRGIGYTVDSDTGIRGGEQLAAINLGNGADVESIQAALDADASGNDDDDNLEEALVPVGELTLRMQNRIGFGVFSTVFRHPENGRVYKLFKERDENDQLGDLGDQEPILRRAAFNSEVSAYEIAMSIPSIRPLVPTFYGQVVVDKVLAVDGSDISDRYLLDCCYVIDFVEGPAPAKFTREIAAQHAHLQTLTATFEAHGINHWHDGAVFHAANPANTKVADFALKDEYSHGVEAIALAE